MMGIAAVGFLVGVIVELCIDTDTIRSLQDQNHKLKLVNEQLRKQTKQEVIEIVDKTVDFENIPSFDKKW